MSRRVAVRMAVALWCSCACLVTGAETLATEQGTQHDLEAAKLKAAQLAKQAEELSNRAEAAQAEARRARSKAEQAQRAVEALKLRGRLSTGSSDARTACAVEFLLQDDDARVRALATQIIAFKYGKSSRIRTFVMPENIRELLQTVMKVDESIDVRLAAADVLRYAPVSFATDAFIAAFGDPVVKRSAQRYFVQTYRKELPATASAWREELERQKQERDKVVDQLRNKGASADLLGRAELLLVPAGDTRAVGHLLSIARDSQTPPGDASRAMRIAGVLADKAFIPEITGILTDCFIAAA